MVEVVWFKSNLYWGGMTEVLEPIVCLSLRRRDAPGRCKQSVEVDAE